MDGLDLQVAQRQFQHRCHDPRFLQLHLPQCKSQLLHLRLHLHLQVLAMQVSLAAAEAAEAVHEHHWHPLLDPRFRIWFRSLPNSPGLGLACRRLLQLKAAAQQLLQLPRRSLISLLVELDLLPAALSAQPLQAVLHPV